MHAPEPPAFLAHAIDARGTWTHIGEWDIDLGTPAVGSASEETVGLRLGVVHGVVDAFLATFPWARISRLATNVNERGESREYVREDVHDAASVVPAAADQVGCGGAEAELALELDWCGPDGVIGTSWLTPVAKFLVDHGTDGRAYVTLTISINLFPDVAWLPGAGEVALGAAGSRNRARLRKSLAAWVERVGGRVETWSSDVLTEDSVDARGFTDTARLAYG